MSKMIKRIVKGILQKHNIVAPPIPIELIAKKEGVLLKYSVFEDNISGLLYRKNNKDVIGVNEDHSPNRQRFTIAHEFGHYILNHQGNLFVDKHHKLYRNEISKEGTSREERQANKFAAEILMPEEMLINELSKYDDPDIEDPSQLNKIAEKFKVSPQALTIRLANLGVISL